MSTQMNAYDGMNTMNMGGVLNQPAMTTPENNYIESRFGRVKINRANSIYFPRGILGFPENLDFCLADFPSERMSRFKVLQCINDADLAFAVLPMDITNDLIDAADISEAMDVLGIEKPNAVMMLIVSVHRKTTSVSLSVNLRAPLFIDTERKLAAQYVFTNNNYEIRHIIQA